MKNLSYVHLFYFLIWRTYEYKEDTKEKEKHVQAVQVLNELLEHATMYDGKVSLRASQQPTKAETKVSEVDSSDDDSREDHSDDDDSGDDISESSKNPEQSSVIANYVSGNVIMKPQYLKRGCIYVYCRQW